MKKTRAKAIKYTKESKEHNMKKGQLFLADISVAILVFALMLVIIIFLYNALLLKGVQTQAYTKMEKKAEFTIDKIYPLISNNGIFDTNKTQSFFAQSQSQVDNQYNVNYNFSISLLYNNGTIISIGGNNMSIGASKTTARFIVSAARYGYLNDKETRMVIRVW